MTTGLARASTVLVTLSVVVGLGASAQASVPVGPRAANAVTVVSHADTPEYARVAATAGASAAQRVVVVIPPVVFQRKIEVRNGALRTAVLITRPGATGIASVPTNPGCMVTLSAGRTGWLSCQLQRADDTVVVRLDDGTVASRTTTPVG